MQDEPDKEPPLPKLDEMVLPTAAELLLGPPVDWVVLKYNRGVIVCEPVSPRPDTLEKMQAAITESLKWPRPPEPEERDEQLAKRQALNYLELVLPGRRDEPEYRLHRRHIDQIIHHEDLILRRTDVLLDEGKFREAFDLLFALERRRDDWPGIADRQFRLLFLEAEAAWKQQRPAAALVTLEELHSREAKYPGLRGLLGSVVDRLIAEAVAADDYRQARHFLARLTRREPAHSVGVGWTEKLLTQAQGLLEEARTASHSGRHDAAARLSDRAAYVWPQTPGLRDLHRRFTGRYQELKVGVVRLPGEPSVYPLPADADSRHQQLTQSALFEIDHIDEAPRYRTRWFEQWEPTDLGRRTHFTLRQSRPYWESQPVLPASTIAAALAARLDPDHPAYDERLAGHVDSLIARSPHEFEIRFARPPLRTEALLSFPITDYHNEPDSLVGRISNPSTPLISPPLQGGAGGGEAAAGQEAEAGDPSHPSQPPLSKGGSMRLGRESILSRRFVLHGQDDNRAVFVRSRPEPDDILRYHVAQVTEVRFDSHDKAVQALRRGEVSMLPQVQPWDLERLRADGRFFVQPYMLPVTHVLQFNPASPVLRNRELRRALEYGLDRPKLLSEVVLRDADAGLGRVVSAPFPSRSYAYNGVVQPRRHDLTLGLALAVAAKKQWDGGLTRLRMVCVPDPIAEAAAAKLVEQWARIGIEVELIGEEDGQSGEWDILYRTVRMAEPLVELWPFLTLDSRARVESLAHLPDWLRQQLIALDHASGWDAAVARLKRLHQLLWAEVELIPLWEVDEFLVIRKTIRGFPPQPIHPYQGIERWTVQPWYPPESP